MEIDGPGSISTEYHYICPIFLMSPVPSARREGTKQKDEETARF